MMMVLNIIINDVEDGDDDDDDECHLVVNNGSLTECPARHPSSGLSKIIIISCDKNGDNGDNNDNIIFWSEPNIHHCL